MLQSNKHLASLQESVLQSLVTCSQTTSLDMQVLSDCMSTSNTISTSSSRMLQIENEDREALNSNFAPAQRLLLLPQSSMLPDHGVADVSRPSGCCATHNPSQHHRFLFESDPHHLHGDSGFRQQLKHTRVMHQEGQALISCRI